MYIDRAYLLANTQHQYIKDLCNDVASQIVDESIYESYEIINRFTGQKFEPTTETILIKNGNGTSKIDLNYKIINISSLTIDSTQTNEFIPNAYSVELLNNSFTVGFNNVVIEGQFGWNEVPQIVKIVAKRIVEFLILSYADTQSQAAFYSPYKTQSTDGESYSLKDNINYKDDILNSLLKPLDNSEYKTYFADETNEDGKKRGRWGIEVV